MPRLNMQETRVYLQNMCNHVQCNANGAICHTLSMEQVQSCMIKFGMCVTNLATCTCNHVPVLHISSAPTLPSRRFQCPQREPLLRAPWKTGNFPQQTPNLFCHGSEAKYLQGQVPIMSVALRSHQYLLPSCADK